MRRKGFKSGSLAIAMVGALAGAALAKPVTGADHASTLAGTVAGSATTTKLARMRGKA